MKRSIKSRLVKSFMFVIIITVVILEVVLINGIKIYYYKNVEDILSNQMEFSTNFYSRYFSSPSLEDVIIDDVDLFWQQTTAQVQIFTLDGELLMDSLGVEHNPEIIYSDISEAIDKGKGKWIGTVDYDKYPVMAVSVPLKYQGKPIGIIRFVSSLKDTNAIINQINKFFIWIGLAVILISGIISLILANSIVKPLREVTKVAEKMADGQLKVRSELDLDDEIGRLSNTLNFMAEEILRKEQIKNDFISSVSHELRTPLTSIKGWAITLKSDETNDQEVLMIGLDIIEKESDRLTTMVEDLLDFSRFYSGRIGLEKESFDIKNTITLVCIQLLPKAKMNKVNFNFNIDENLEYIVADENRFKQVLINILDNAFKFTEENGNVSLSASKEGTQLLIVIQDDGIGISDYDLPNVKEKFYKGKNSKSHSGIGLSICDEIINLHGGTFEINSEEGTGTVVTVKLPLEEEII